MTGGEEGTVVPGAGGSVQSISRAIGLMEIVAARDGTRLTDLARAAGLSLSTTHRLMTTLQQHSFVQCNRVTNRWHVGRMAFVVGTAFARPDNFVPSVMQCLHRLRDRTGDTVSLGMMEGGQLKFVSRLEGRQGQRAIGQVGGFAPLTASGMGKALLAEGVQRDPRTDTRQDSGATPLVAVTPKSIRCWDELQAQLSRIRERGFAMDDEECQTGVRCVAATIYNQYGEPQCAVSVSGGLDRLTDARVVELGGQIREAAAEMTAALRGQRSA